MTTPTASSGTSDQKTDWTAFALLVMTGLCWSGNTVFVSALHESITPAGVSFWRTILTVLVRGDLASLRGFEFVIGDIWVGVAVIGWSIYAPFVQRLPREIDPFVLVTATTFCGGIGLIPFYLGEVYWLGVTTEATWETLAIICYIALFGTIVGVVGWSIGIARIGPSRASTFLYLIPVFTVALGVGALGEAFHIYHVVGMVLVFIGVAITNRVGASRSPASAA